MRAMSEKEIKEFMKEFNWGTLIAIDGDRPYAIELSYACDDAFIYCGSLPGGRMANCIKNNQTVAFKICDTSKDMSRFRAVIVEGKAKILTDRDEIKQGLHVLYKKLGYPESRIEARAEQLSANPERSSFYRIPLQVLGGRTIGW